MPRWPEITLQQRVHEKVTVEPNGCHVWTGVKNSSGYGQIHLNGKTALVTHVVWQHHTGQKVPEGMCVCHRCDNRACVNPEHLFLDTKRGNSKDMVRKGRQARGEILSSGRRGEKNGRAKLTNQKVIYIRSSSKTQRELANELEISLIQISRIRRRKIWKHI